MKIKSSFKYSLSMCTSTIIPMLISFAALIVIGIIITLFTEDSAYFGSFEGTGVGFAFVMGIVMYKLSLEMSIQNGISRRTAFIGRLGASFVYSFIISLIFRLFYLLGGGISLVFKNLYFNGMYEELYPKFIEGTNSVASFFSGFIFYAFMMFAFISIGMFIGNAYYVMNKAVKLIVSIGVPVFLFTILPTLLYLTGNVNLFSILAEALAKSLGIIAQNPFYAVPTCTVIASVFMFFSYLMSRKAVLK